MVGAVDGDKYRKTPKPGEAKIPEKKGQSFAIPLSYAPQGKSMIAGGVIGGLIGVIMGILIGAHGSTAKRIDPGLDFNRDGIQDAIVQTGGGSELPYMGLENGDFIPMDEYLDMQREKMGDGADEEIDRMKALIDENLAKLGLSKEEYSK